MSDVERCLAAGMDGYLAKPITPKELDATLRQYGGTAATGKDSIREAASA